MAQLILITEAARRLGLNRQTVSNWIENGILVGKKIGKNTYVDGEAVDAIGELGQKAEEARLKAEELKDAYDKECNRLMKEYRERKNDDRLWLFTVRKCRYNNFFKTVLRLLQYNGILSERESNILCAYLNGESLEEISSKYETISRERVRQIVERALRKSNEISEIGERLSNVNNLEAENLTLKRQLKEILTQKKEEKIAVAKDKAIRGDYLYRIYNTLVIPTYNEKLSVRALNTIKGTGAVTVGDLCKMNKTDILKERHCGRKTLKEITDFVENELGLNFGADVDTYLIEYLKTVLNER